MAIGEFIKRNALFAGILLMFLFTWPIDLANAGWLPFEVPFTVSIFVGWGFIFASLIMTGIVKGKAGVASLLRGYLRWRVSWKWYVATVCLYPIVWITGVYLYAAISRAPLDFETVIAYRIFGKSANLPLFILPWFLFDFISNGEEIGWRGYILPRVQAKYNALASALITGLIWGFWHLPKFLSHFNSVAFAWFMIHTLAFSIVLTWLYNSTRGSLLLVGICHATINTVGVFLPVANTLSSENLRTYIAVVILEVAVACVVTVAAGPERLSQVKTVQIQPYAGASP